MKAYCFWNTSGAIWWVSELPGNGGKDWGYTIDAAKAIDLSPYWARRFAADQRRCNRVAFFEFPAPAKQEAR